MDIARSEEQQELANIIQSLLAKRSDSEAVRVAMASETGYDESLWQALCEQVGVAALCIPEEYDGFGAGLVETSIALEALGSNLAPNPLLASASAAAALILFGSEAAKQELLPRIAAGTTACLQVESDSEVTPLVLEGTAEIVLRVVSGDLQLVANPTVERVGALDQTLRFARISDGTNSVIGSQVDVAALVAIGQALASALQVGGAQRGLDMTVAYSKEREQFGRTIGSFQALKHRMADMLVQVEASRSASWGACAAAAAYLADPNPQTRDALLRLAAVAKAYCSEAFDHVAAETIQLHGGIAITWEHDAHLVFKRAHALSQLFGRADQARAGLLPTATD
ncbi:MAG TPA: acyl-CoA dehydrogenase family protein [Marmoricola sp.]|nr:acyl-CoA dehydrogenase family protein [Marmoricola sp.]